MIYLLSVAGAFVFLSDQNEKPAIPLCWDGAGEQHVLASILTAWSAEWADAALSIRLMFTGKY